LPIANYQGSLLAKNISTRGVKLAALSSNVLGSFFGTSSSVSILKKKTALLALSFSSLSQP